jgi:ankyrin repeat protein
MIRVNSKSCVLGILLASSFSLTAMEPQVPTLSKAQADELLLKGSRYGPLEDVKHALNAGADATMRDKWALTPLHYAAASGYSEIIRELINNGAQVNAISTRGVIPLHWAACNGYLEATQELIAQGANVNAIDDDGKTPLFHTIRNCCYPQDIYNALAISRELLAYGARPFPLYRDPARSQRLREVLKQLLTAIERAAAFGTLDELANFALTHKELRRALALAVGQGRADIVAFLVSNYNFPQPVLFDALRIIRVILTRFELLRREAHDDKARTCIAQEREPYQAIYALLAGQIYRVNSPPVAFLDRLPSEIFKLLLWFVISAG